MTLEAGWLQRQLDRVADDVDKWPEWMKREAEFAKSEASLREAQCEPEQDGNRSVQAGSDAAT